MGGEVMQWIVVATAGAVVVVPLAWFGLGLRRRRATVPALSANAPGTALPAAAATAATPQSVSVPPPRRTTSPPPPEDTIRDLGAPPMADVDADITVHTQRFSVTEYRDLGLDTVNPALLGDVPEEVTATQPFALILVTAVGRTDVGRRRKHNEDDYLVLPEHHVFVIADGIGGHAAGEVASRLAVDTVAEAFRSQAFEGQPQPNRPRRGDELVRAVEMANAAIHAQAQREASQSGMGTTVVAARFSPNKQRVYIAHVGDSRCYRLRDGVLSQLTTDHTLESMGVTGPQASKLIRAVGILDHVDVDLIVDEPRATDQYLLCSDGLSKMVPDADITEILADELDIERACQRLVLTANERGGRDNITVILVRVEQAQHVQNLSTA